tara:strand:+ start:10923 stop:12284 length:1362 start_codon:yes stop_codon:yes gene_type:complete
MALSSTPAPARLDQPTRKGGRRAWAIVIFVALFGMMSYIDRQALAVVVSDLRLDLGISDVQMGWLMGPAFFVVFNLALVPAAWAADRWNRKRIIVFGVVTWSLLTMGSGLAQSYEQLLLLRCGVALGEAMLAPAALSLIAGMFERYERPLPTATYVVGCTIGASGSALFTAAVMDAAVGLNLTVPYVGGEAPWRLALLGVGLPGLILVTAFVLVAWEPVRKQDHEQDRTAPAIGNPSASFLRENLLLYLFGFVSLCLFLMNMSSVALWGPSFLVRTFEVTQVQSGYMIGVSSLIGGVAGSLLLPALIRHFVQQRRTNAMSNLVLGTMIVAATCAVAAGFAPSLWLAVLCIFGFMFFAGGAATMPTLMVQLYAPQQLTGRLSAVALFILYFLSYGLAPVLVPMVADSWETASPAALGYAIASVALGSSLIALPLFAVTRPMFRSAEAALSKRGE